MTRALVLMGRRSGALDAADAIGLPVVVVSTRPIPRHPMVIARLPMPDEAGEAAMDTLAEAVRNRAEPVAVLALTEGMVLPAARLRTALGLDGLDEEGATLATDKLAMKRRIREVGLPCADFCGADEGLDRESLIQRLGLPLFVKQRRSSGSRGTVLITSEDQVPARLDRDQIAERMVSGKEMSMESFLMDGEVLFTNLTDYFEPGWANVVPGKLKDSTRVQVDALNRTALRSLGIRDGIAHMEFFVQENQVVFGEVAARPPGGHLMSIIRHAWQFDAWQALLGMASGTVPAFPGHPVACSGVRIFHPGPGVVSSVEGVDKLSALPSVKHIAIRAWPGREYGPRTGVGEEAGHVIVAHSERARVQGALRKAARLVRFRMRPAA